MRLILNRIKSRLNTTLFFWNYRKKNKVNKKNKLNVGWYGPFPPSPNGAAVFDTWFLKEMYKGDINIFLIPFQKRIDKKMFKGFNYAKLSDRFLDIIVFYCVGDEFQEKKNIIFEHTKVVIYQLHHGYLDYSQEKIKQFNKIDLVVFPTKWGQKTYIKYGLENTKYIPHAIDTNVFMPIKKQNKEFTIGFVSRWCFYKGAKRFLEMAELLLNEGINIKFRIHGNKDNVDERYPYPKGNNSEVINDMQITFDRVMKKYKEKFVFTQNWDWKNFAIIKEKIYDKIDLLVFPSNNEGFGMPLIEAMSCNIPCVVLDTPPMNELVINGVTGFCLPYLEENIEHGFIFPSAKDLKTAVLKLYNNRKLLEDMGVKARERVKQEYDLNKTAKDMINLLSGVIKKNE
jgi:glycosyltransferase involved in cell wall biosynthesis